MAVNKVAVEKGTYFFKCSDPLLSTRQDPIAQFFPRMNVFHIYVFGR
jgi:hypothetical protein